MTWVKRYGDLVAVMALCGLQLVLVLYDISGPLRTASGLAYVALLPGYALLAAFYRPHRPNLSGLEHTVIAIPVSLAFSTVAGQSLNAVGLGMESIALGTWIGGTVAIATVIAAWRVSSEATRATRSLGPFAVGVLSVCLIGMGGAWVAANDAPEPIAALYVVNANGELPDGPVVAAIGDELEFRIGVTYGGSGADELALVSPDGTTQRLTFDDRSWQTAVHVTVERRGLHPVSWRLIDELTGAENRSVRVWIDGQ